MKSSVTVCSATSVTSSRCAKISCSSRSNGPSKLVSRTWKPLGASDCSTVTRQSPILFCATRFRGPGRDWFTGDAGLGEADRSGDDGVEHQIAESLQHPGHHLAGIDRARIEAGDEDAADAQLRIQAVVHLCNRVGQQRKATEREVLAFGGNDHAVRTGQPVYGQQSQRR